MLHGTGILTGWWFGTWLLFPPIVGMIQAADGDMEPVGYGHGNISSEANNITLNELYL